MDTTPSPREVIRDQKRLRELIVRAQNGDQEAREALVEANLGLIHTVAGRFKNRGYDYDDLFQIGSIGLLKAVDDFDPDRGVKFSTYAVPKIMGEIRRFLRDDQPIRIGRRLKQRAKTIISKKEELAEQYKREPTISELAQNLDLDREEIIYTLDAVKNPVSLETNLYEGEGRAVQLKEHISRDEESPDRDLRLALGEIIGTLRPREKKLIRLRYFEEKTQAEVGEELGVTQVQISRLEQRILKKIKEMYEKKDL